MLPFLVVLSICVAAQAVHSSPDERSSTRQRLRVAMQEAQTFHMLLPEDRRFILARVNSAILVDRHESVLVLIAASQADAFPKSRALALIQQKCVAASGKEPTLYASEFANCLGVGVPEEGSSGDWRRGLGNEPVSDGTLNAEERSQVDRSLILVGGRRNLVVESTLIPKRNLDTSSYRWGLARLDRTVAGVKGPAKPYWAFIRSVFVAHNAKNPLRRRPMITRYRDESPYSTAPTGGRRVLV